MSKKLFSLAPLVAIIAFALVPAVSQAAEIPHWYKNGLAATNRQAEGKPIPVVTWGETKNLAQNSPAGEINCKGAGAGNIENPKGTAPNTGASGPAGVGETEASTFYECVEPGCTAAVAKSKEPGEPLAGLPGTGKGSVLTNNFPWKNQLKVAATNPNGYPFVETIGAPSNLSLGKTPSLGSEFGEDYPAKDKAPSGTGAAWGAPGSIGAMIICEITPNPEGFGAPRVAQEVPFEGELSPFIGGALNESGTASHPAKVAFEGANTGGLDSSLTGLDSATNTGGVKYLGYNEQSVIAVAGN